MDISQIQKQKIEEIAEKYCLKLVLLFGSQADDKTHKESDFDVAYLSKKNLDFNEKSYLNFEFTNVFRHNRVDTIDMQKASPLLLYAVFQRPVILYAKDSLIFFAYRIYAFKKYIETKPLYEEKFKRLKEKISKIKK